MIDSISETAGAPDLKRTRRRAPAKDRVDRLPPHSTEAEQAMLGCILLDPQPSMGACVLKLKDGPAELYDLRHQTIYQVLTEMWDKRTGIDTVTLAQNLKDRQRLEEVGGVAYLGTLPDAAPSAANLPNYLNTIHEKYVLRRMIHVCTDTIARAYEHEGELELLTDEVARDVLRTCELNIQSEEKTPVELVRKAIRTIEDLHQSGGKPTGICTGFSDLDRVTRGLQAGDMIVIAARPSLGKTSLAMNIADHVAVDQKLPVGVFSLEMTAENLMLRAICSRARVNLRNVGDGSLSDRDFPRLTGAAGKLANAPLHIDDTRGLSILQLRAKARRMFQQYGIKLFVIDYIGLLHSTSRRAENRQQEVADISSGIHELAGELNVPVIVLCQLSRLLEREKNRKPRMADLRESGAIEQDADVIGMLYKTSGDDDEMEKEPDAVPENLLIVKQRNGPSDVPVPLMFMKTITRFESAAKVSDEDVPDTQPNLPMADD